MRGTRKSVWLLVGMVALFMLALGAAASASTGQDGPVPPEVSDPVAAENDIWTVVATADFTLTFNASTTATISADASPAQVEGALDLLGTTTDVRVRGTAGSYVVTIADPLAGTLTGTGATATQTQAGAGPITGQITPHGGYSAATDYCLQCHAVHDDKDAGNPTGSYALMAKADVTAVCNTCHSIGGSGGNTPIDPGNPSTPGTVSMRSVYDATTLHPLQGGHPDGGDITESEWDYDLWTTGAGPAGDATTVAPTGASGVLGGLYCASCHTPHGDYGQMVNMWAEGDTIRYDWPADEPTLGDPAGWADAYVAANGTSWDLCRTDGTPPTNCMPATIEDAEDQKVSLYGYKLLSAYPNHTYSALQSYNIKDDNLDSASWCTTCHTSNDLDDDTYHNHNTGCNACHGNPADGTSSDFPHSSTDENGLIDYPDALCISCHTPGSLP